MHNMKKLILVSGIILTAAIMMAQNGNNGFLLSGSVIYEQIVQLNVQLNDDAAQFANAIPKERKSEKILHFNEEVALFENHHTDDPEELMDAGGDGNIMIKMVEPDNKLYTDLEKKLQIEQKEFMSRLFLIESELPKRNWKLTGEQKTILDYHCQQAVTREEDKDVLVWFTTAIAIPAGPGKYGNLPGLVLHVDIDHGELILQAKSIELKKLDKSLLKKPVKGKEVSQEEYLAIVEEKMKEMGVEGQAGNNHAVVVRIQQ